DHLFFPCVSFERLSTPLLPRAATPSNTQAIDIWDGQHRNQSVLFSIRILQESAASRLPKIGRNRGLNMVLALLRTNTVRRYTLAEGRSPLQALRFPLPNTTPPGNDRMSPRHSGRTPPRRGTSVSHRRSDLCRIRQSVRRVR